MENSTVKPHKHWQLKKLRRGMAIQEILPDSNIKYTLRNAYCPIYCNNNQTHVFFFRSATRVRS